MESILAIVGALLTGALAWYLRGARARADLAPVASRLAAIEQLHTERTRELEASKAAHVCIVDQHRDETQRRAAAEERATRLPELTARIEQCDQLLLQREARIATLETQLTEERKTFQEQRAILEQAQAALADSFKALSADALKSNNQAFIELAKATLEKFQDGARNDLDARHKAVGDLVKPLKDSLEKVDGKLGDIEKDRLSSYSALNEQLKGLVETHLPILRNETANLVKALRQPATRGRWGELQLKRVVEMAGMVDHCDFLEQENLTTDEGRLRPDLVVKLPGGRNIVVDAKAPVSAYLEAIEATDDTTQRMRLAQHAQQVRAHISSLGRKGYWEQFTPSPEFVVLFLPGEVFFSAALQEDPSLIEAGVNEKVIVTTPTTLIALLRAVAYGWRQEALAQNAKEIAQLGKDLYDRIVTLGEHWNKVGECLGKTVDVYNKSTAALESRVLVQARKFRDLKVHTADSEIESLNHVDKIPRMPRAEELVVTAELL